MLGKLQDRCQAVKTAKCTRPDDARIRLPVKDIVFHTKNRGGAYVNQWAAHTIADRWIDHSVVNAQSERGFRDESLTSDQLSYKPPPVLKTPKGSTSVAHLGLYDSWCTADDNFPKVQPSVTSVVDRDLYVALGSNHFVMAMQLHIDSVPSLWDGAPLQTSDDRLKKTLTDGVFVEMFEGLTPDDELVIMKYHNVDSRHPDSWPSIALTLKTVLTTHGHSTLSRLAAHVERFLGT